MKLGKMAVIILSRYTVFIFCSYVCTHTHFVPDGRSHRNKLRIVPNFLDHHYSLLLLGKLAFTDYSTSSLYVRMTSGHLDRMYIPHRLTRNAI